MSRLWSGLLICVYIVGCSRTTKGPNISSAPDKTTAATVADDAANDEQGADAGTAEAAPEDGPRMVIPKTKFTVRDLWQGDMATFPVTVRNEGDEELVVDAKPGCGCTRAEFDPKVPPGGQIVVKFLMDTSAMDHSATKIATISSNDSTTGAVQIYLTAEVKPYVAVLPYRFQSLRLKKGERKTVQFTITSNVSPNLEITGLEEPEPYVKAKLTPMVVKSAKGEDWKQYRLDVTVTEDAPVKPFACSVTLHTNEPKAPKVFASLNVMVERDVVATPTYIAFGNVPAQPQAPVEKRITVMVKNIAIKLTTVTTNDSALTAELVEKLPAVQYELVVKYNGGWRAGERKNALVTIHTNDDKEKELTIPVSATVQ